MCIIKFHLVVEDAAVVVVVRRVLRRDWRGGAIRELGAPPDHLDEFAAFELEVDVFVVAQDVWVVDRSVL